jgi:hypothetical protein
MNQPKQWILSKTWLQNTVAVAILKKKEKHHSVGALPVDQIKVNLHCWTNLAAEMMDPLQKAGLKSKSHTQS